ncbi:MAG: aminoacetone oxidase family FAD-binding enzyme [candidate division Zixibacteria bacterium]|nr:aminoacetone oxidase family FAD-binding enzyme [candidate division Zixibacteria bacterium]
MKSVSGGRGIPVIAVVGGGPAGVMAAIAALEESKRVIVYNKNPWPGKKISAIPPEEFIISEKISPAKMALQFGEKAKFVNPILKAFTYSDLMSFFKRIGFDIKADLNGHFRANGYPIGDIIDAVRARARELGVEYMKSARITDIVVERKRVSGVVVNGSKRPAAAVILATGSISSPKYGATADGYEIARRLGHNIREIRPAMVDLIPDGRYNQILAGGKYSNIKVTIQIDGKSIYSEISEIKFTQSSISGPAILNHSAEILEKLPNSKVELNLDLLPQMDKEQLNEQFAQALVKRDIVSLGEFLAGQIGEKMTQAIIKFTHIDPTKSLMRISNLERKALILAIKDFHIGIKGAKPFNYARGVKGGIDTDFIDPETGQSKIIKGLYFAGAVMDVLGPWGGYNMQFAFSSGYVAGKAAAAFVE